MSIQEERFKAIADAIREKDGSTEPIIANNFAERIKAIHSGVPDEDMFTISASTENPEAGTVTGSGILSKTLHAKCSVIAEPSSGWNFQDWTENGVSVANTPTYEFEVEKDRNLVANFSEKPIEYTINVSLSCGSLGVGKMYNTYASLQVGGITIAPGSTNTATSFSKTIVTTQNPVQVRYSVRTTKFVSAIKVYVNGTNIGTVQANGTSASTEVAPQDTITIRVS